MVSISPAVCGPTAALQRGQIDVAVAVGGDLAHRVAAHHRRGRIGAVRRIRHQDLGASRVAARVVIGADHRHAGKFALRARHRRERDGGHAGHFLEHFLQFEQAGQKALPGVFRASADGAPETAAAWPAGCRRAGCTSWCRSRAGRSGCRWRNSSATAGCNGAPRPFRRLPAAAGALAPQVGRDVVAGSQGRRAPGRTAAFGLRRVRDQHVSFLQRHSTMGCTAHLCCLPWLTSSHSQCRKRRIVIRFLGNFRHQFGINHPVCFRPARSRRGPSGRTAGGSVIITP